MSDEEPGYLQALRRAKNRKEAPAPAQVGHDNAPTLLEREAAKWAREVGGPNVRVTPSLSGARVAVVYESKTSSGIAPVVLEGLADRTALAARLAGLAESGEAVLGCYDVTAARALTAGVEEGKTVFRAGPSRNVPRPMSPEQMLRRAAAEAEKLARTRKVDDRRPGGGQGGRGGNARGR
jgi:hypothetical protein